MAGNASQSRYANICCRTLASSLHLWMESKAGEFSKRTIAVEVTSNMGSARDIMLEYNISRVIVVVNGKPVGMVTEKAIGSYLLKNIA